MASQLYLDFDSPSFTPDEICCEYGLGALEVDTVLDLPLYWAFLVVDGDHLLQPGRFNFNVLEVGKELRRNEA